MPEYSEGSMDAAHSEVIAAKTTGSLTMIWSMISRLVGGARSADIAGGGDLNIDRVVDAKEQRARVLHAPLHVGNGERDGGCETALIDMRFRIHQDLVG